MAQGVSDPAAGQCQGPTMGSAPRGAPKPPIVQVTFDVLVFRVPTDGQTRQQPKAEVGSRGDGQRYTEHERSYAAPPSPDNPNPKDPNFTPPAPNAHPTATDAFPPMLRQSLKPLLMANPRSLPPLTVSELVQLRDGLVLRACFLVSALAPPMNSIVRILPGQKGLSRSATHHASQPGLGPAWSRRRQWCGGRSLPRRPTGHCCLTC